MLPPRRTQMDSLVQPLVAQYLAMGCQSKENQNESITTDDKGKDDVRVTSGCTLNRSRISPPSRHRFHKPVPTHVTPNKPIMSLGHLTKGGSWEELIQACLDSFGKSMLIVLAPFCIHLWVFLSAYFSQLWGVIKQGYKCRDCGMNCHKLCKDQVAFECKKNTKAANAVDSPTPSSTPVATSTSEGSEECPFPHSSDVRRDWSPESPITPIWRPATVHSYTQTEAPQLSSITPEASRLPSSLLVPIPPSLPSCPSPVPLRKQRYCAKWENRASIKPKEPMEENKPTYESLECENLRLRRKLKEAEREVEILKALLKRHALHPVEEDSSS
ncbi:RAS guanyl-releasing protein 1 [Fundulus heteroclitus]|uniref:RAS guanyl-releasing protein 1 n=1 Tax=Fundulus heteroclitus TaxID=8078 RepID=UPI00165B2E10|nr:RAS guanyl-releasing protein 1 [Fundulus heteroclitus]